MNKVIALFMAIILLVPFVNLVMYVYCNVFYCEDDTLIQDLQNNLDYYNDGNCRDTYLRYYGENIKLMLEIALTLECEPLSRADAITLLAFKDIDPISKAASLPMLFNSVDEDVILGNLQFFEINGTNYLLCYYFYETMCYKLYSYEDNAQLNDVLDKECFLTDGLFASAKSITIKTSTYTLVTNYIPVIVVMFMMFVPHLFFANKRISLKTKRIITLMAKVGFIVVTLLSIWCSIRIYKYVDDIEVLKTFGYILKRLL